MRSIPRRQRRRRRPRPRLRRPRSSLQPGPRRAGSAVASARVERQEVSATEAPSTSTAFDPADHPNPVWSILFRAKRDSYLNVDFIEFHELDLVPDGRHLSMLPSDRYVEIIAIDCLEHLPRPETDLSLQEWARLLAPGGVLRIRTSNVLGLARLLAASTSVDTHRVLIQSLFGTQAYPGDFHVTGFTEITLMDHLARAGLTRIVLQGRDGWLFDAEGSKPDGRVDTPLAVSWGRGCYRHESDESLSWRWFDSEAEITVVNTSTNAIDVTLRGQVETGHPRPSHLVVDAGGARQSLRVWRSSTTLESRFRLHPGPALIRMSTDAARVEPPQDERSLFFRLIEPSLTAA